VRLDSGFYRTDLLADCRARGARFSVSVPRSSAMWAALERIEEHDWAPAEGMERAEVAETGYRPAGWAAEELRLIVRRVAHSASELSEDPRARRRRTIPQEQLAMGIEGRADPVYGYSFVLTDRAGSTTCVERHHRERAQVEERIKDQKLGVSLRHLPFSDLEANRVWLYSTALAPHVGTLTRNILTPRLARPSFHEVRERLAEVIMEAATGRTAFYSSARLCDLRGAFRLRGACPADPPTLKRAPSASRTPPLPPSPTLRVRWGGVHRPGTKRSLGA